MDYKFLYESLTRAIRKVRKSQREYYSYQGDPRTDPIKKAYLEEARRREQDLDTVMKKFNAHAPVPEEE